VPSQVRIIQQRNSRQWDELVDDVLVREAHGQEHEYFGITDPDRADKIRRALRTAARRKGVGAKVYWNECKGCTNGGAECRYHVKYTLYDMAVARQYKADQAASRRRPAR
jgi:hypothetical protein